MECKYAIICESNQKNKMKEEKYQTTEKKRKSSYLSVLIELKSIKMLNI